MALNQNILIAYNDFAMLGTASTSVPTMDGAPITNITLPELYSPVIFTPADPTGVVEFKVDLGQVRALSLIAMLKHNINYVGLWRVMLNANDFDPVGQEYDSGWNTVIPPQPGFGALPWGTFLWGGAIPEYNLGRYNRHAYCCLPNTVFARYITIQLKCPGNTLPIKFFRLWASFGYQPSVNVAYGADITPIDETKVFESAKKVRVYGEPIQRRTLNCGFDMLPKQETFYNIIGGLFLASGTFTNVIGILEPLEPQNFYVSAVYGNLKQIEKSSYSYWGQFETAFGIDEAV